MESLAQPAQGERCLFGVERPSDWGQLVGQEVSTWMWSKAKRDPWEGGPRCHSRSSSFRTLLVPVSLAAQQQHPGDTTALCHAHSRLRFAALAELFRLPRTHSLHVVRGGFVSLLSRRVGKLRGVGCECVAYAVAGIGIHNPNTDKIISFRGSRRALTEVMGRVTLEEAASCDPGTRGWVWVGCECVWHRATLTASPRF